MLFIVLIKMVEDYLTRIHAAHVTMAERYATWAGLEKVQILIELLIMS